MELLLIRDTFTQESTQGTLYIDDQQVCFTLEDTDRKLEIDPTKKIHGKTAIPIGTYKVTYEPSPRFKKNLPRLHNVPGFSGVLIHPGNTAADTEGCILVGNSRSPNAVGSSRAAFATVEKAIKTAWEDKEPISITIERAKK